MADKPDRDNRSPRRGSAPGSAAPVDPVLQAVLMAFDMPQVTTRRDLQEIQNRIAAFEVKAQDTMKGMRNEVDRLRGDMDTLNTRIAEMVNAEVGRAMRDKACPSSSGSSTSMAASLLLTRTPAASAWVPRFFRVRGWAPPKAPPEAKISKSEAIKLDEDIRRSLPAVATTELELGRLGVANYELRYYVSEASESQLRMRGCTLTCSFQVNPDRARRYKLYKEAMSDLERHLGPSARSKWGACDATLHVYSARLHILGSLRGEAWEWDDAIFVAEGFRADASSLDEQASAAAGDTQREDADMAEGEPLL